MTPVDQRLFNLASKVSRSLIYVLYKNFWIDNKPWIKSVAWLFLVFVLVGGVLSAVFPGLMPSIIQVFKDKIGTDVHGWHLFSAILSGNIVACLVALVGGIFVGLGSLLVIVINAILAGFVGGFVLHSFSGAILFKILFLAGSLLPHGIFEIPAIILAGAVGFRLGLRWLWTELNNGSGPRVFVLDFKNALKAIPLILILLVIAAFIETFVTSPLSDWIGNTFL